MIGAYDHIFGESILGHYVPQLSQIVYERNKGVQNPVINFRGFLVRMCGLFFFPIKWLHLHTLVIWANAITFLGYTRLGMLLLMITMIILAHLSIGGPMV